MTASSEKHDAENTQAPQTKYQTQKVNTTHTTWGDEDRRIYDEHQDEKHRTPSIHITCNIKGHEKQNDTQRRCFEKSVWQKHTGCIYAQLPLYPKT